ncbi:MAG: CDP-alcohol phosphatidyltransferase family protein, partial [Porticoccus sp.]|nr:CDP-alcohol phosphatidyltransferase family protein [Porticoccus sp.]
MADADSTSKDSNKKSNNLNKISNDPNKIKVGEDNPVTIEDTAIEDVSVEASKGDDVLHEKSPHKGIYLLPNLFTTGAMFAGFYAILAGMDGKFEAAAIAIFVAMIFDGLDGTVARMTHTSSEFGVQYDSLSDMVSFGVAPAVVAFSWILNE